MYRACLVLLFSGLIALAAPVVALAQDTPSINVQPDGVKAEAVFVVNQGVFMTYVMMALLVVVVILLGLAISQLAGIKAALEKKE